VQAAGDVCNVKLSPDDDDPRHKLFTVDVPAVDLQVPGCLSAGDMLANAAAAREKALIGVAAGSGDGYSGSRKGVGLPPVGSRITLDGLSKKKYNGQAGLVVGHADERRAKVILDDGPNGKVFSVDIRHVRHVGSDADVSIMGPKPHALAWTAQRQHAPVPSGPLVVAGKLSECVRGSHQANGNRHSASTPDSHDSISPYWDVSAGDCAAGSRGTRSAWLPVGSRITLDGLSKKKYNGQAGLVVGHADERKAKVILDDGPNGKVFSVDIRHVQLLQVADDPCESH
jgi:ribosomal protein L21E